LRNKLSPMAAIATTGMANVTILAPSLGVTEP